MIPCPECGGVLPFAARRCAVCAHDRVALHVQWSDFLIGWKLVGTWCVLNARGVYAVSQRVSRAPEGV